ncbi:MAG: hypothetical protein H0T77_09330 [Pyrinomonadaceae bacterium]|nr:hypothetical protein [Pyrinomonadaceae bacterium]
MQIIGMLVGLASLVCFIMVLIKQFQNGGAVHGIIGIITCGIWTFIWGWINAGNLNIKNLMMAWTLLIIVGIAINVMFGSFYAVPTTLPTNTP